MSGEIESNRSPAKTGAPEAGPTGGGLTAGRLGMILFLAALGMLFVASLTGYLVVRSRAVTWPPEGSPRLPGGLWLSTLVLLVSSGTMFLAQGAAKAGRDKALRNALIGTLGLGLLFLLNQFLSWQHFVTAHHLPPQRNLYAFTFYMLTGLHAAHVIGGLAALTVTAAHAARGRYRPADHAGVEYMSMYWHFLGAVWLVMFLVLLSAA